jgi:hypothetical protein
LLALVVSAVLPGAAAAALPTANTGAATSVTGTSATLAGTINPNNEATTYYFQYGTTKAYGSQTPTQGPSAANKKNTAVTATVSGLAMGTTYHYRLVGTNASGTRQGRDKTFTTLGAVSLTPRPRFVLFGASTQLAGQVVGAIAGGAKVALKENPFPFTGLKNVGDTQADGNGRFAFTRAPTVNSQYQASTTAKPTATSATILVFVRPRVSLFVSDSHPSSGQRVVFSGRVKPPHNAHLVVIQRLTLGKWRPIRRATLVPSLNPDFSTYRTTIIIRRGGRYRTHFGHDADHAPSSSAARRLTLT